MSRCIDSALVLSFAITNGCVIVTTPAIDDDPDLGTGGPSSTPAGSGAARPGTGEGPPGGGLESEGEAEIEATETGSGDSESGVPLPGPCNVNVLADPGFEAGTPNPSWIEDSLLFSTPLCNGTCSDDPRAEPHGGDWWVWFGGVLEAEVASVSQAVVIPPGTAELSFSFAITAASSPVGDDTFTAYVDDVRVFRITDAAMSGFSTYQRVSFDVSAFADGDEHTIVFTGETTGLGLANFFVDDVALEACADAVDEDTSARGTDDGITETAGSSTSEGEGETGGTTGSSSEG